MGRRRAPNHIDVGEQGEPGCREERPIEAILTACMEQHIRGAQHQRQHEGALNRDDLLINQPQAQEADSALKACTL